MESRMFQTALREYFEKYKAHPQYNFWIRDHLLKVGIPDAELLYYIRNVVRYIHKTYMPNLKKNDIKILDLGCGMGEFATFLSLQGYNVIGADMDKEQLKLAKTLKKENKAKVEFVNADASRLPFRDGEFNIIICFDVFEHIENLYPICIEMNRVLDKNGTIFLRFPNKLKGYEDHVGLSLLPLLPEKMFQIIFRKITKSRKYYQKGLNVYYRRFSEIYDILKDCGFYILQLPESLMFPRIPSIYKQLIKDEKWYPVISPYFHLLLTKNSVKNPLQQHKHIDVDKIRSFEYIWWLFVLITSIVSILKNR